MQAKRGRPPKDNPKSIELRIRIDAQLDAALRAEASRRKTTVSELVRDAIALIAPKAK